MEPKKEITPLDRLQHVFNDVLEDLTQTIKRTWAYQDYEDRLPLQEALDAKLETYRELHNEAMEAIEKQSILLNNLIEAWNEHDANGTKKEQSEFFHVFRRTIIESVMAKKKAPALGPFRYFDGSGQVEKETP